MKRTEAEQAVVDAADALAAARGTEREDEAYRALIRAEERQQWDVTFGPTAQAREAARRRRLEAGDAWSDADQRRHDA